MESKRKNSYFTNKAGHVRLSYQLYFFSKVIVLFSTTNQRTVLFSLSFQRSEQILVWKPKEVAPKSTTTPPKTNKMVWKPKEAQSSASTSPGLDASSSSKK
jgi:hypothetical protein